MGMALFLSACIVGCVVALQPTWRSIITGLLLLFALAADAARYVSAIAVAPRMLEFVIIAGAFLMIASFYVLWRQVSGMSVRSADPHRFELI